MTNPKGQTMPSADVLVKTAEGSLRCDWAQALAASQRGGRPTGPAGEGRGCRPRAWGFPSRGERLQLREWGWQWLRVLGHFGAAVAVAGRRHRGPCTLTRLQFSLATDVLA